MRPPLRHPTIHPARKQQTDTLPTAIAPTSRFKQTPSPAPFAPRRPTHLLCRPQPTTSHLHQPANAQRATSAPASPSFPGQRPHPHTPHKNSRGGSPVGNPSLQIQSTVRRTTPASAFRSADRANATVPHARADDHGSSRTAPYRRPCHPWKGSRHGNG